MSLALAEAEAAAARGEVPVGAVIAGNGEVVAKAGNRTRELSDPTAHAEMLVIREASKKLSAERLGGMDLYVTLEPCAMCAGAISFARIRRLYFGASDEKGGAVVSGGPGGKWRPRRAAPRTGARCPRAAGAGCP